MAKPFSVVAPTPGPGAKLVTKPVTRERHPFAKINPSDIAGPDGRVDPADFPRTLQLVQDNVDQATTPYRTNPLLHGEIHRKLSTNSGTNLIIPHGLGEAFANWSCRRAYAGSSPFSAVEAANNGGQDPNKYLVLAMSSTGVYDIEINPG